MMVGAMWIRREQLRFGGDWGPQVCACVPIHSLRELFKLLDRMYRMKSYRVGNAVVSLPRRRGSAQGVALCPRWATGPVCGRWGPASLRSLGAVDHPSNRCL